MTASDRSFNRRSLLLGSTAVFGGTLVAANAVRAVGAQDAEDSADSIPERTPGEMQKLVETYGFLWSATSPSTHLGDVFEVTVTNRGSAMIKALPYVTIMDHTQHSSFPVIEEALELAPGESRASTATNDYGVANHFSTNMLVDTGDTAMLGIEAVIRDSTGAQTTSFNECAFWIRTAEEFKTMIESKKEGKMDGGHHGGHQPESDSA